MPLADALVLWIGGYINVLLLGFQSRNAIAGRYVICALTSFLLAITGTLFAHAAAHSDFLTVVLVTGTSGAAGICTAIFVNTRIMGHRRT